jgi:hypothetical protein
MSKKKHYCGNCKFWDKDERCKRHAPRPLVPDGDLYDLEGNVWAYWPRTEEYESCGEHEIEEE